MASPKYNVLVTTRFIPHNIGGSTGEQLAIGFREAGYSCTVYGNVYGRPYDFRGHKEVQAQNFDLVVNMECNDGMPGYEMLYEYYKLKDIPKIYWDFDISYNEAYGWQRAGAYRYDGYLVGNKLYVGAFEKKFSKPSLHLPYACSPTIHRRKLEIAREHAVGFVGTMTPEREALMGKIHCVNGAFGEALIDETNKIRTMVHINQNACKGLVPGRPWETAGCGTCLLMDQASFDDFKEFLPSEVCNVAVSSFATLEEVADYTKRFDIEVLERSAKVLMDFMHERHSYKNRAETILSWAIAQGMVS